MSELQIRHCDLSQSADAEAFLLLMEQYARDPMGGGKGLTEQTRRELIPRLRLRTDWIGLLAWKGSEAVGLLNAFEGFSTFRAAPLLNVHDVIVAAPVRRTGVAQRLFSEIEQIAIGRGCCKLTLEVLQGNHPAQALYQRFGFAAYELDPEAGQALFWEKPLNVTRS